MTCIIRFWITENHTYYCYNNPNKVPKEILHCWLKMAANEFRIVATITNSPAAILDLINDHAKEQLCV